MQLSSRLAAVGGKLPLLQSWGGMDALQATAGFDSRADLQAATVPAYARWAFLAGYADPGDGGLALYRRVDAEPAHQGKIQSVDAFLSDGSEDAGNGGWWELVPENGMVRPKQFGAMAGGLTDATTAISNAIGYAAAHRRLSSDGSATELQQGYPAILLDNWFQVSSTLTLSSKFGVTLIGAGPLASGLIFTGTGGTLFDLTGWGNIEIRDLGLVAGSVSQGADGKPDIALETGGSRTNICFDLDGTGGGTQLVRRNCMIEGWAVADRSITGPANGDNVRAYDCLFIQNDLIADNTNSQAVIWRYMNCKFRHNENTFRNLGGNFLILGCDIIDKGAFLEFTGIKHIGEGGVVEGCKFEDYQNIDPTMNPKWLVVSGAANVEVLFRDCSSTTGTPYAKTGMSLAGGIVRVTFDHCELTGELAITAGASVGGLTPTLIFDNSVIPTINQTLVAGQGSTPINLLVRNSRLAADDNAHQVINRQFWGSLASAADEISVAPMRVAAGLSATINATSSGSDVPIWCPAPYKIGVMGMKVIAEHSTTSAFDIILWADSTKKAKLLEIPGVGTGTSGVPFFEEVRPSGLITQAVLDSASDPLYLEVVSAGNAGFVAVRVEIDLMQATL